MPDVSRLLDFNTPFDQDKLHILDFVVQQMYTGDNKIVSYLPNGSFKICSGKQRNR